MHALRTTRATVCGARDDDDDGGLKFKHMKKQNPYMCVHARGLEDAREKTYDAGDRCARYHPCVL